MEVTLCYALVLPGRKSAFRAGIWPDCYREITEIGSPAGLRPKSGPEGRFPGRKHYCVTSNTKVPTQPNHDLPKAERQSCTEIALLHHSMHQEYFDPLLHPCR